MITPSCLTEGVWTSTSMSTQMSTCLVGALIAIRYRAETRILDLHVFERLGGGTLGGFQQVAVAVDHLDGLPAVAVHHFADARPVLQERGRRVVAQVVEAELGHAGLPAELHKRVGDGVRVVGDPVGDVRREHEGIGLDSGPTPSGLLTA